VALMGQSNLAGSPSGAKCFSDLMNHSRAPQEDLSLYRVKDLVPPSLVM
jgi:hypothetical protein